MEAESVSTMIEAVDAHAHAAGGRHAVLHGLEEVLVELVGLLVAGLEGRELLMKRSRWSSASLSSLKALEISMPPMKPSKRSTKRGSCGRLLGERADLERVLGDEHRLDAGRARRTR